MGITRQSVQRIADLLVDKGFRCLQGVEGLGHASHGLDGLTETTEGFVAASAFP